MKKLLVPAALIFLTACSAGPVDDNKKAECSQLMGRIIHAPSVQSNPGQNFLGQYQQQRSTEAARAHARKVGCIE